MRKPELLVPASSLEVLKVAVIFGADAVYIGGEVFGLRAKAKNFSMEDMKEGIAFAHAHGVKVYVTANILAHNQDLTGVRAYFGGLPGNRAAYQYSGKQYELRNVSVLVRAGRKARCDGKRAVPGRNPGNPGAYSG